MSNVFFIGKDITEVSTERFDLLKHAARQSLLKRSRFCLHMETNDIVQEMVIAFCRGSYVRPHRHIGKSESFHVIEGVLMVVFFNDLGQVKHKIKMGTVESGKPFLYRLNADMWHALIPLSEYVIIHETTSGPFEQGKGEFAEWSPEYGNDEGIRKFMEGLF